MLLLLGCDVQTTRDEVRPVSHGRDGAHEVLTLMHAPWPQASQGKRRTSAI